MTKDGQVDLNNFVGVFLAPYTIGVSTRVIDRKKVFTVQRRRSSSSSCGPRTRTRRLIERKRAEIACVSRARTTA